MEGDDITIFSVINAFAKILSVINAFANMACHHICEHDYIINYKTYHPHIKHNI